MRINRFRRGDTLIEVLFAIAIVGLVLAGAYKMASVSRNTSRGTQERTEALKVAEGQLESMKSITGDTKDQLFNQITFCLSAGSQDILAAGSAECRVGRYDTEIRRQTGVGGDYFIITVSWIPPNGRATRDEVKIVYGYPE